MNYKTSFTATKAGNFRATGGMPIVRDLSEMAERHSASQYRMMLQEIDSFLMTKYAYFDTEVCKTMASDYPDIGQINHKMFLVEYKQFLKKSSGRKHHSIAKSESKKFISPMRDTPESSNYDSILLCKISNLVSDASETRGLQLIPIVIRLIGLLSNISDKQLAISKLIGAYQDLDERPRDRESSVLSHKYALSLVFSSLEIIY